MRKWLRQSLKNMYSQRVEKLYDRKISHKLHIVYILCVLIPVIVTNTVIVSIMVSIVKNDHRKSLMNIVEVSSEQVSSAFEKAVALAIELYMNPTINNFLVESYQSPSQYYDQYFIVYNSLGTIIKSREFISQTMLYADNETMYNSGNSAKLSSVMDEEWYKIYTGEEKDLLAFPYYREVSYENQQNRIITVVRKLDYFDKNQLKKLVKIDLNYNLINAKLDKVSFGSKIYCCQGDNIIFTNDKKMNNGRMEFVNRKEIENKEIQIKKTVNLFGNEYEFIVTDYKTNYFVHVKKIFPLIILLLLVDAVLPALALKLFSESITTRIFLLGKYLNQVKEEKFEMIEHNVGQDEISELIENYNIMTSRMKELIEYEYRSKLDKQELELARKQAELQALYCQINPHFMFNVLESIRMHSILKGEEETSLMIESLAKLMRKSAEWGNDYITIEKEVQFTEDFLRLQKYRYGEGFTYSFHIEPECKKQIIPSLALVTFAENACVHGMNRTGHSGSITISVYMEDDKNYCIEIADTGVGIPEERVTELEYQLNHATIEDLQHSKSLGMLNACIRFKKFCSENVKIQIESVVEHGTCITICIPLVNE